ncbi:IS91 family transposase [Novosphingobium sp. G106]|uniref:IS91 family transposase n=1 Tax=Novosphingobium sp. G106 TaxID=2849500 RepID=UPI001C2D3E16|nr:IS91 family transposase [Novosphingobium sp. G106]MBV1688169.1 IS91 family transposase [Novosphingobium sp. G106]MBV1688374.1 IS91 family transposase [Novosphingobium sp. G106]MBV1692505.1 IS91 family transposase [Novosphingobium sp. G106]MBV1692525.1 IS91 family transposase [Novosphingobium sp. G106]MBV1692544.1 IS91 family transposase [Novosphingobium sp. G106]
MRSSLEVADIFCAAGPAYRVAHAGHLSLYQLKVMTAVENCRTAALGGHVEACEDCGHWRIAYNSCRNRHCPKCQGAAARTWLAEREADLLPVGYFHVVFTLPAEIAAIAWQNKAVVYDLLFKAASETMLTIAADPKHLGARIGITAVLHTWGSAMTHHPHVHMIVPGGGIALDGMRWISSRPAFLLPVRVLGALFRRLFVTRLIALHDAGRLFFGSENSELAGRQAFLRLIAPVRKKRWVVYAKAPFAGPQAVLAYLSRYTHRVAISNRRLIAFDERGVTMRYKDYRRDGLDRQRVMTLAADEFIRRFLLHVLPRGFHRIRHYGLLAGSARKDAIARARALLHVAPAPPPPDDEEPPDYRPPCPCCGGHMVVIETFVRWQQPRAPPRPLKLVREIAP